MVAGARCIPLHHVASCYEEVVSLCRIDRGRLLRDREYLLQAVCAEFQKAAAFGKRKTRE